MRAHWTDPDYGISQVSLKFYFLVRVNYLDPASGKVKTYHRRLPYTPLSSVFFTRLKARDIRDELLQRDEVKAYLQSVYANPNRRNTRSRKQGNKGSALPVLPGITVSVDHKRLASGITQTYYGIRSSASNGFGQGFAYASWSVLEYGLRACLLNAAQWRAQKLNSEMPSANDLSWAESQILDLHPDIER